MCSSYIWRKMENDGDLSDVVRVAGGFNGGNSNSSIFDWKFSSSRPTSLSLIGKPIDFSVPGSMALDSTSSWLKTNIETGDCVKNGNVISQKILGEEGKRPCANLFSRVLQMSSGNKMSDLQSNNFPIIISSMEAKSLSFGDDLSKASGIIGCSSPRIPGIKRRKNQAKKVICIPAPAAANNKPSGEVVPSDLWAWRKYGQKPIKGSPYPRGYYRCSSSKGCSARKQVERSRTDPSMLVITYTSEHNHPWPTQRNALAGSTRSQSLKKNSSSNGAQASKASKSVISKEEKQEMMDDNLSVVITGGSVTSDSGKDETKDIDKTVDVDSLSDFSQGFDENHLPSLSELNDSNDFFPDFSEFEQDSIESIFSQGFNGMKSEEERENKNIDPFNIFGW